MLLANSRPAVLGSLKSKRESAEKGFWDLIEVCANRFAEMKAEHKTAEKNVKNFMEIALLGQMILKCILKQYSNARCNDC